MAHGQPQYAQRIVPCECGSTEPYWHGPEDGAREYCCDVCWAKRNPEQEGRMKTYRVSWEIDIDAESPRAAAEKAQAIQRDPESLATVFDVIEMDGDTIQRIDLEEAEDSLSEQMRNLDAPIFCQDCKQEVEEIRRTRRDGVQQCVDCTKGEEGPQA